MSIPYRLTAERLRNLVDYCPETGQFFWKSEVRIGFHNSVLGHSQGDKAGTARKSDGRNVIRIEGRTYLGYRLAWLWMVGRWPIGEIDHIDGNPINDCFSNLREVSRGINQQNLRRPLKHKNSSEFLGVFANKPGRRHPWIASICLDRKQKYLGAFLTEIEASEAYLAAKRSLHAGCTL